MAVKRQEMFQTRKGRLFRTEEEALKVDREESIDNLIDRVSTAQNNAKKIEAVLKYVIDELPSPCTNKQLKDIIEITLEEYGDEYEDDEEN